MLYDRVIILPDILYNSNSIYNSIIYCLQARPWGVFQPGNLNNAGGWGGGGVDGGRGGLRGEGGVAQCSRTRDRKLEGSSPRRAGN